MAEKKGNSEIKSNSKNGGNNGKSNGNKKNSHQHPIFSQELTTGQKASDVISSFGGSWTFIFIFALFLFIWMGINTWVFLNRSFDPYPFILLNLVLSSLAAMQAPIILMAQNRQVERDRIDAKYDHQINRKAEREIQRIQKDLYNLRRSVEIKKRK